MGDNKTNNESQKQQKKLDEIERSLEDALNDLKITKFGAYSRAPRFETPVLATSETESE